MGNGVKNAIDDSTKNNPLISVIIPVYNVEQYLCQCLDSVLAQTYTNYEAIMVDDGSADSSYGICREYSAKDKRFKTYHKENGGASSARNLALQHAGGEYLFFLDSDDWIESNAFEKLIDTIKRYEVDFVIFEADVVDETGSECRRGYSYHKGYGVGVPYRMMREMVYHKEFHVSIPLLFIKRDFFIRNDIHFREGVMYEDMLLAYQIYALADCTVHLHEALYHRRYRENSVVTTKKSSRNFTSSLTIYREVVNFTNSIPEEKQNREHVVRCTYIALNDYRALSAEDKKKHKKEYKELIRDIRSRNAFSDKALKWRYKGYPFWAAYKVFQKLFIGGKADYRIYLNGEAKDKKLLMLMPQMVGGGAERVAAQLVNQMRATGFNTKFFLSSAKRSVVIRSDLDEATPLWLFREEMPKEALVSKLRHKIAGVISSLFCKPFEAIKKPVPARFAKLSITSQYGREIKYLRGLMQTEPDLSVITFLQPTIPITVLAARGLPNRVIISERGDPKRLMKKRYGRKFIERYYTRADAAVFQTEDAKNTYPKRVADKGVVISNPLKTGLPEPYHGERNKNITTFCRISKQKNLPVLIDAFAMLHKEHPEYQLRIIGDASNDEGIEVMDTLNKMITGYEIEDAVIFEPFRTDVHEAIIKDAMYVNSSDYEGISNAMLEAMAIGMPVVCTDCPIGGAKATITDGENGMLVPIKDANPLYNAMKRIIEDQALADTLSANAVKLRDELSLETIAQKWMDLLR